MKFFIDTTSDKLLMYSLSFFTISTDNESHSETSLAGSLNWCQLQIVMTIKIMLTWNFWNYAGNQKRLTF